MAAQLLNPVAAQLLDVFSDDDLLDSIGPAVSCDISARLKADMEVNPVFSIQGSQCSLVRPVETGRYFADANGTLPLDFRRTGQQQFCADALHGGSRSSRGFGTFGIEASVVQPRPVAGSGEYVSGNNCTSSGNLPATFYHARACR